MKSFDRHFFNRYFQSCRWRFQAICTIFFVILCFCVIRLIFIVFDSSISSFLPDNTSGYSIFDRNNILMAGDSTFYSVYVHPYKIAVEDRRRIASILSLYTTLSLEEIMNILESNKRFAWISRHLDEGIMNSINSYSIPDVFFKKETYRFYPHQSLASHVLGFINVDGDPFFGLEKYAIDTRSDVYSSIDVRVQYVVENILRKKMVHYQSKSVSSILMNIHTGEVYALVSLPDFYPGRYYDVATKNNIMHSVYEFGSVFKIITLYAYLKSINGIYDKNTLFNVQPSVQIENFVIRDTSIVPSRPLSLEDIIIYSSNIGAVHLAFSVGLHNYRKIIEEVDLYEQYTNEIGISSKPLEMHMWNLLSLSTLSYGYGVAITPISFITSIANIFMESHINPTFIRQDIKYDSNVSLTRYAKDMLCILHKSTLYGTGKSAHRSGHFIAGKTGTARRVYNKKYSNDFVNASFISLFPFYDPQYILFVFFEEPGQHPYNNEDKVKKFTSSFVAAETSGDIIETIDHLLNIKKDSTISSYMDTFCYDDA